MANTRQHGIAERANMVNCGVLHHCWRHDTFVKFIVNIGEHCPHQGARPERIGWDYKLFSIGLSRPTFFRPRALAHQPPQSGPGAWSNHPSPTWSMRATSPGAHLPRQGLPERGGFLDSKQRVPRKRVPGAVAHRCLGTGRSVVPPGGGVCLTKPPIPGRSSKAWEGHGPFRGTPREAPKPGPKLGNLRSRLWWIGNRRQPFSKNLLLYDRPLVSSAPTASGPPKKTRHRKSGNSFRNRHRKSVLSLSNSRRRRIRLLPRSGTPYI